MKNEKQVKDLLKIAKAFKKSNLNFNNKQGELEFKKDIDTMIMTLEFVLKDED